MLEHRDGIEVRRNTDVGIVLENENWLDLVEEIYPNSERVHYLADEDDVLHTIKDGVDISFIGGEGASIAACKTERLRVYGAKVLARIGTCGALNKDVKVWDPIITTASFSNEGTSKHYLPEGFPIISNPTLNNKIKKYFETTGVSWQEGLGITTDGRWREDPILLKKLNELGVISIEMETSAVLAVALFRNLVASAINIPADYPAEVESDDNFKGVPNRDTYKENVKKALLRVIPPVVEAVVDYHKENIKQ